MNDVTFWKARWILELWSPDKVQIEKDTPLKRKLILYRKTKGIVWHDRVLNQEWNRLATD